MIGRHHWWPVLLPEIDKVGTIHYEVRRGTRVEYCRCNGRMAADVIWGFDDSCTRQFLTARL